MLRVDHCDTLMPLARGRYSHDREKFALDPDLIVYVAPSSAVSCRQASKGSGFRITMSVGCWRLPQR